MTPDHHHRPGRFLARTAAPAALAAALFTSGCEMPSMPDLPDLPDLPALPDLGGLPGVYRIDIQQGNIVDREMMSRVELGMERSKVRFILGTPLLVDPFNQDRWDYVYVMRPGSEPEQRQRVSMHFVDDRLARIEDRLRPGLAPETDRTQTRVKVPERGRESGLLDKLTPGFLQGD